MLFALVLVSAVLLVVLLLQVWRTFNDRQWKMLSKFPGDFCWPLVGNALQIGFDSDEVSPKIFGMWKKFGRSNFRVTIGSTHWVLLSEPEDVGIILSHQTELAKPPDRNAAMIPFFGQSLSTAIETRWRFFRKSMVQSFAYHTLDQRLVHVNNHCEQLLKVFNTFSDGQPVDMYRYIRPFMYDIYSSTLLGIESNLLDEPDHPYLDASSRVVRIVTENYFSYWRHIDSLFKLTSDYQEMKAVIYEINKKSREMLNERRTKLNKIKEEIINNNPRCSIDDVMKMLKEKVEDDACLLDELLLNNLPNGKPIPDDMIIEELNLLSFTGHYTTTMTVSHALHLIAQYPDIQKHLINEQNDVFEDNHRATPTTKELNQMKYLEAVIKETMRFNPTVTKIGRYLENDLELNDGRSIPAGTTTIVYLEALFNNEKVFPESDKFKPERFLHTAIPSFTFVPFSAGPRNCIGFKYAWVVMKATLSSILRTFEIHEGGPDCEPQFKHRLITESKNGVRLRFKKRRSCD